jgi:hypothetical protein
MESLDESTALFIGKTLRVQPVHGYGWSEHRATGAGYTHTSIQVPLPFALRLIRLWSYEGDARRGGVGRVESPGHPLDTLVTFSTRHEGLFNFTDKVGHYNIDMSSIEPTEESRGWPITPVGTRVPLGYQGWAQITA